MSTCLSITHEQKQQFRQEGYFVLEHALPDEHLKMLREESKFFVDRMNAEMDEAGTDVMGLNHRGKRYFICNQYEKSNRLHEFLFSDLMAEICLATLGPEVCLFNEQWVIKFAEVGMNFSWHQDSGYVGYDHKPYLSCWCTLDDVCEENGTVYLLPYSRAGTRTWVKHERQPGSNDLVGYLGDDQGIPVIAPAGSIACFSSTVFHRSSANRSKQMRRVYLPQYSTEPILSADGSKLRGRAIPFLKEGKTVARQTL